MAKSQATSVAEPEVDKQARKTNDRSRPKKILPTDRIRFPKQLDQLRAIALSSGPSGRVVTNKDVAVIVGLKESTLSLSNPFFNDSGLTQRADGGYIPSAAVVAYAHAYAWNPETAAQRLSPVISQTWFAQAVMPMLSYAPMEESALIARLADVAEAPPDYKDQLETLVDYLQAAGLVEREGSLVKATPAIGSAAATTSDSSAAEQRTAATFTLTKPTSTSFFPQPTEGIIQFGVSVRVNMAELSEWNTERISAFFAGVAQVLSAKAAVEKRSDE